MLFILSIEEDISTSNVIDWLLYLNKPFDRLNHEDLINCEVNISNSQLEITLKNDKTYKLKNYDSYWYRRGNFLFTTNYLSNSNNSECVKSINKFYFEEKEVVQNFIHAYLKTKPKNLNCYEDVSINKLTVLYKAKELGLNIPDTIVTTNKIDLKLFIKKYENIITKPIYIGLYFDIGTANFCFPTTLINENDIADAPEHFSLTKFQACINKAFELRIFFINNNFFSSAIFSQNDEKTKIDFRNYNEEKPNRVLPFKLPKNVKGKLQKLMSELKLNSGSIDIIVSDKGEYIFLEVNPIGQFTQVSLPCNYYLEKIIAEEL